MLSMHKLDHADDAKDNGDDGSTAQGGSPCGPAALRCGVVVHAAQGEQQEASNADHYATPPTLFDTHQVLMML